MMCAFGYSSSGTMKTGKQRIFLIAELWSANGSDSGPPSSHGSPLRGTNTEPFSNWPHQPVRYQPLAMLSSSK